MLACKKYLTLQLSALKDLFVFVFEQFNLLQSATPSLNPGTKTRSLQLHPTAPQNPKHRVRCRCCRTWSIQSNGQYMLRMTPIHPDYIGLLQPIIDKESVNADPLKTRSRLHTGRHACQRTSLELSPLSWQRQHHVRWRSWCFFSFLRQPEVEIGSAGQNSFWANAKARRWYSVSASHLHKALATKAMNHSPEYVQPSKVLEMVVKRATAVCFDPARPVWVNAYPHISPECDHLSGSPRIYYLSILCQIHKAPHPERTG